MIFWAVLAEDVEGLARENFRYSLGASLHRVSRTSRELQVHFKRSPSRGDMMVPYPMGGRNGTQDIGKNPAEEYGSS